ncbi:MAG: AAA family ATPase [Chloroflexi bacterium]|nr:AAA family ATPase [Chloroflexota bacterium]
MSEERRLVTVLFADVTGSTALGESLDPEDLRALLGRFFAIAQEVTTEHGGTVEKFIGDAVMAVFGLPTAHGDDASRALAAALELRDRVRADPGLGDRLPIRIGVNTGEVVATPQAAQGSDFLMTGDAVNVAARLQQAARTWSVLVGERTARAAPEFRYGDARGVEARGKTAPVRARQLLGRTRANPMPLPLLGRETDLAQLDLVARRTFEEHRPYLVSVIAPAGTGKTRLLEEFLSVLQRTVPDCLVATAQCLPYGQRLTFWPLRAILQRLVGAGDETPPERLRDALVQYLDRLGADEPQQIASRLLATIGAGEEDATDRGEMFAAWRTTFEMAARERPLVVVFEDLHWSSESFLDLVEYVTQPRGQGRLLMLVLTRGELLDRRPGWGGGRRNHVSLALDPLDEVAIADLVRHLFESASPEIIRAVAERSEGNPFYAGELVRALIDLLGPTPRSEGVATALASLPDTVQATVLARLDALPARERRCLQVGAIFGRSFRALGLAALEPELASEAGGVGVAIDALLDREMVRPSGADGYTFRHILIREVAYGTLPRSERARLHAAAGRWLEDQAAGNEEAYAELIAYHYREAATLSGLLSEEAASEARRRAVTWLRRAADTAFLAGADVEARSHLMKALEWAPPDTLPDIHERIGDTMVGGDATVEAYAQAYGLARSADRPPNDQLRVLAKLIEYEARFQGSVGSRRSLEAMDTLVEEGRALAGVATDLGALSRFHVALGFVPYWRFGGGTVPDADALRGAEADARLGLEYAEKADDAPLRSAALDALGAIAMERGRWPEVRQYGRARLGFRDRLNLPERIDASSTVVWASTVIGDLQEADQVAQEALMALQPGQAPSMVLHLVSWRAQALYDLGRWDEVLKMTERAERLWIDIGRPATLYAIRGFLSGFDVARARREPEAAHHWQEICEAILGQLSAPDYASKLTLSYLRLDVAALARQLDEVPAFQYPERFSRAFGLCVDRLQPLEQQRLERWLRRAMHDQTAILEGEVRRALAVARDDAAEAERALAIFDRCAAAPHAARVRCDIGIATGNEALFNEGMRALESLGDLDQLERYAARAPWGPAGPVSG